MKNLSRQWNTPACGGRFVQILAMGAATAALSAADPAAAQSLNLRDLLPDFLARGVTLAPPAVGTDHSAHFNAEDVGGQFDAVDQINAEIAYQLSAFPQASSAGGFAYELDPELGVFNRPTRSFGPIYTERAFNVGKGKLNIGVNYNHSTFDWMDDIDLRGDGLKFVFQHVDANDDGSNTDFFFEGDLVTSQVFLKIETNITALVTTYGLSDRLDFGLTVPMVEVDMDVSAESTVERLATADNLPDTHTFPNGTSHQSTKDGGSAQGIGDVTVRAKYRLNKGTTTPVALLGELRLPTGDEENLLGVGALGGRVSLVASLNKSLVAPHLNVGYAMNDEGLPDELSYRLGLDWVIDPKITLSGELLGLSQSDVRSVSIEEATYQANTNPNPDQPPTLVSGTFEQTTYTPGENRNTLNAAIGLKMNLTGTLLLTLDGLFPLTDEGLRDEFTPLLGLDYSF